MLPKRPSIKARPAVVPQKPTPPPSASVTFIVMQVSGSPDVVTDALEQAIRAIENASL